MKTLKLIEQYMNLLEQDVNEVDVNEVKLKQSVLGASGPVYSDLKSFSLI